MPDSNGCYTSREIADRFQVPIHLVRRMIDRLKLGTRIGGLRVVFIEDIAKLEIAFQVFQYVPVPDPTPMAVDTAPEGGASCP